MWPTLGCFSGLIPNRLHRKTRPAATGRCCVRVVDHEPRADQLVVVAYQGRRVDGVVFDGTAEGATATFPLKAVIKGWREGLGMMSKGAKWELFIPPELAYGATSPSELIPANSTLIFTVELIEILDEAQP